MRKRMFGLLVLLLVATSMFARNNFVQHTLYEVIRAADEQLQELKRLQEVEEKYQTAVKILGEKELEIEILRELLKKKNPAYLKDLKQQTSLLSRDIMQRWYCES